jgi:hypothetical protein
LQVSVWQRKTKLMKKDVRHVEVIVLTGMNHGLIHFMSGCQRPNDWCSLGKVGARTDYVEYMHTGLGVVC